MLYILISYLTQKTQPIMVLYNAIYSSALSLVLQPSFIQTFSRNS